MKTWLSNNQKGFSLIELVLVIVLLALVSLTVAPKYIAMNSVAAENAVKRLVANIQDGINISYAEGIANGSPSFISSTDLDTNANGPCSNCFDGILAQPLNDACWQKLSSTTWFFDHAGYTTLCVYNAALGRFSCS